MVTVKPTVLTSGFTRLWGEGVAMFSGYSQKHCYMCLTVALLSYVVGGQVLSSLALVVKI